jgi:hypothetical protein
MLRAAVKVRKVERLTAAAAKDYQGHPVDQQDPTELPADKSGPGPN